MVEDVAGTWLRELLGFRLVCRFRFVTGGRAANTVVLAVARYEVLVEAGWDVEHRGPPNALNTPSLRRLSCGLRLPLLAATK